MQKVMTAAVQLKRAKEKDARNKKKTEREEQAKELAKVSAVKHNEDMKQ